MISDAYTREYDERQRQINTQAELERIARTAQRLGLETILKIRPNLSFTITFQDGKKFKQFRKIETATRWADKWK